MQCQIQCTLLVHGLCAKIGQELEFHGVELSGPAKRLQSAGSKGTWKQNIARDMMRQVGKVVP